MVNLHGSTAARAGRYLLPLLFPACCALWVLLFFPSPPVEVAVFRQSFQPSITLTGQRAVDTTTPWPSERREIVDTSSPPLPTERHVIVNAPPPLLAPARQARTEMSRQAGTETPSPSPPAVATDRCAGRYIYIHDLPRRFNSDLVRDCRSLSEWTDMCKHLVNAGMGPRLTRTGGVLPSTGWYDTNQFALEVIFHSRMRRYDCLTTDAARAAAVYVPYYAGLDVGRHLWGFSNGVRDALAEDLFKW